ncbi:MAG TPA: rhamnulokinase [Anaeromyxobacteraceae bacterium]|nr:rhamnulokinase [Anaeromyxobacteraceae bacterium]
MGTTRCAAVDLGASSGRVVVAETDGDRISLRETARFSTPLVSDASGHQCWDLDAIEAHVREGLRSALASTTLASVGVDSWGVDYVLLDAASELAAPAVSYRDGRTQGVMAATLARMPATEIYRRTGIQFLELNTLYQLAATAASHPDWLRRARRLLMLSDYFHFRLCGAQANEYTNSTTTQLWDIHAHDWDDELLALAGISRTLLERPVEPGTVLGDMAPPSPGAGAPRVIAPATHDTASSVAAIPLRSEDDVYISSGTWSLMGFESRTPIASEAARRLNVTNEGGVERRYRVLKNIAGLWVAERIRAELGIARSADLVEAARAATPWRSLIDPDAPCFFNPPSMVEAVRAFCAATGQPLPDGPGALARCAFESLALSYRSVARELASLRERPVPRIHIVGGGSQNHLLDQLCADACELEVRAGPAETSALGNACVQLMGLGVLPSLHAVRALVGRSYTVEEYAPRDPVPDGALRRFAAFREDPPPPGDPPGAKG